MTRDRPVVRVAVDVRLRAAPPTQRVDDTALRLQLAQRSVYLSTLYAMFAVEVRLNGEAALRRQELVRSRSRSDFDVPTRLSAASRTP